MMGATRSFVLAKNFAKPSLLFSGEKLKSTQAFPHPEIHDDEKHLTPSFGLAGHSFTPTLTQTPYHPWAGHRRAPAESCHGTRQDQCGGIRVLRTSRAE